MSDPIDPDKLLTKQEAADLLNVSLSGIEGFMAQKIIPYYKLGKSVRFKRSVLLAHLDQHCRVG
jgi:excisionase family DNA binding protein